MESQKTRSNSDSAWLKWNLNQISVLPFSHFYRIVSLKAQGCKNALVWPNKLHSIKDLLLALSLFYLSSMSFLIKPRRMKGNITISKSLCKQKKECACLFFSPELNIISMINYLGSRLCSCWPYLPLTENFPSAPNREQLKAHKVDFYSVRQIYFSF